MKRKKQIILILIILIVIVGIIFLTKTYSKYTSNSVWNYYLQSRGFYFASDNLGTESVKNVNKLWDGGNVIFNVKNNLNKTVITNYDINYSVTCEVVGKDKEKASCYINGTNTNTVNDTLYAKKMCINNTNDQVDVSKYKENECVSPYIYDYVPIVNEMYFNIIPLNENYEINDIDVILTVTSTNPYYKVLTGEFNLHKNLIENSINTIYSNYSNYDQLIISNKSLIDKCVSITWNDNNLHIDNTKLENAYYTSSMYGYINNIKVNIPKKTSLNYIFYKMNNDIYNINDFTILEQEICN